MGTRISVIGFVFACLFADETLAQGLLQRLPADGTWSRYRVTQQMWDAKAVRVPPHRPQKLEYPVLSFVESDLLLQSVGNPEVDGKPCRWIEIVRRPSSVAKRGSGRVIALRLLAAEETIVKGQDCFDHCLQVFHSDSGRQAKELTDPDRKKYELERFRPIFPRVRRDVEKKIVSMWSSYGPNETTSRVEQLTFNYAFRGKLSGGKSGSWDHAAEYRMVITDDAPFGVAYLLLREIRNREDYGPNNLAFEMVGSTQIVLLESGTGATSALPMLAKPTDEPKLR